MKSSFPSRRIRDLVVDIKNWNPLESNSMKPLTYIDIAAVSRDSKQIEGAQNILPAEAPSRARQIVQSGDVLVSTVRPNLNAVAAVGDKYHNATASTGFCVLRPNADNLDSAYLFHWVQTDQFVTAMTRKATGASYPAVSDNIIKESTIPLPPLSEQRRIAAILDKADGIRRKREEGIRLTEDLLRSTFLDMFGDPTINSKGWDVVPLHSACHQITDGEHKRPVYVNDGIPFISVKDITTGILTFHDCKFVSHEDHKTFSRHCKPEFMDILYTKVGATYGRPALVDVDRAFSLYVSVALIKPNRTIVDPVFLREMMASPCVKNQADRCVKGAGVPDLHLVEIKSFKIPLPPMKKQLAFVEKTKPFRRVLEHRKQSLQTATALFGSLVQRAFRGKL